MLERLKAKLSDKQKRFANDLILGIVAFALVIILENTVWYQKNCVNSLYDIYANLEARFAVRSHDNSTVLPQILFVDIDDVTYRAWGRPNITPRDELAKIIQKAYDGGAKVIVLDVALEEPDYSPVQALLKGTPTLDGQSRDKVLWDTLEKIRVEAKGTKVILPTQLYSDQTLRNNLYRRLVDKTTIFEAAPIVKASKYDDITRIWQPYAVIKNSAKPKDEVLWTVPILTAVLGWGDFSQLEAAAPTVLETAKNNRPVNINIKTAKGERELVLNGDDVSISRFNRIRFHILPSTTLSQESKGNLPFASVVYTSDEIAGKSFPISYRDKIVIIGNSSPDRYDILATPVGEMPGLYLQGNIVNTLVHIGSVRVMPTSWNIIVDCLLIASVSYLSAFRFPRYANELTLLIVAVWFVVAYFVFMATGYFLYIGFPLLGISLAGPYGSLKSLWEQINPVRDKLRKK